MLNGIRKQEHHLLILMWLFLNYLNFFRLQQQLDKVAHCTPKSLGSVECFPQEGVVGLHCLRAVV